MSKNMPEKKLRIYGRQDVNFSVRIHVRNYVRKNASIYVG